MMFRRKMCSTQMKRTVQIVKCIYMSEPHEQSLTVFITDNHAKIFFWGGGGGVKVDAHEARESLPSLALCFHPRSRPFV